ncbi:MAG: hypothetical protein K0S39_665 [Paenibacillus sp.]|jgi:AraC-like DNA-binding protein|nr:hypothetical protein [Paenibacillus sp.]
MLTLAELTANKPVVPYIRQGSYDEPRKPWRYPERRLLDYLLVYIQEGTCRFRVDGQEYLFKPGQFCFVQPGSLVDLEGLTNTITPFVHFDIFYHPERERSFPTKPGQIDLTDYRDLIQPKLNDVYGIHIPIQLEPVHPVRLKETLIQMLELWTQPDPLMQLKAQQLAAEIIISILDSYYRSEEDVRVSSQAFNWITSYMSLHLSEPLTIGDLSKRANLSVSRFSALFKKRYGTSPHKYLLEMRVNHAKELLENTDLSHADISSYCGFADIHHFSKSFKKRTGQTPGAWRKG